jgi:hypothetical protein
MNAEELAAILPGGAKKRGDGEWWDGLCPAHADTRPSLSFRDDNEKKKVQPHCHKNPKCSEGAIASALHLRIEDFYHDSGSGAKAPALASRVVAEYEYRDEAGELLYVVVRREPKDFRQRRPDGHGGWFWNLDGVRRVLYRLPELIAELKATPPGERVVYIAEGEKDVDRLWALGIPATCNSGGAGKWREADTQQLQATGAEEVVILPDNDTPGDAHAKTVARSCLRAGLAVKIVRLPGLPPKGDVSDWLDAGHTREELVQVVKEAPILTLTGLDTDTPPASQIGPVLRRLSEVKPEEVSWLWPGRLARGKLTLVIGDPGLGKSFLTLDLAARISAGREWPDGVHTPPGDVILLSAEDGIADTIRPRVDALGGKAARVWVLSAVKHEDAERPFCLAADLPALKEAITQTGALLVVIDPLSAYLGKTESYKDSEVRGLLAPLAALVEQMGVAVLGVMHLTKDAQRRAIYRAPGSIAFVAAARVVLAVAQDTEHEHRRLLVPVKNNLTAPPSVLAFSLSGGRLEWEPEPLEGVDAETVLGGAGAPEDRAERQDVDEFLQQFLKDGPAAASQVFKAARANGLADRTLYRAKRRLGIRAERIGGLGKDGQWFWSFPVKVATGASKAAISSGVAVLGERREQKDESARGSAKAATFQGVAVLGGDSGSLREEEEWGEL